MENPPVRVLFLCTGNSARSQMAEALLCKVGGTSYVVQSAGTEPKGINPLTYQVMGELGCDLASHFSKGLEGIQAGFDYAITLCDDAAATCPRFAGARFHEHWAFPDPAAVDGSREVQLAAFREVRDAIARHILLFVADQQGVEKNAKT